MHQTTALTVKPILGIGESLAGYPVVCLNRFKVIPMGHFKLFLEDALSGLDKSFLTCVDTKTIVSILMGFLSKTPFEHPSNYLFQNLSVRYLRWCNYDLITIAEDETNYEYVIDKLTKGFESLVSGFSSYISMCFPGIPIEEITVLRFIDDDRALVTHIDVYDPLAL